MPDGKVTGTVYLVDDAKTYGSRGTFKKRLVVLTQENERSTNYVPLEFVQQDCKLADDMRIGEEVEVEFVLKGREWQKDSRSEVRYFLNAEVVNWKSIKEPPTRQQQLDEQPKQEGGDNTDVPDDEIPF